MGKDCEIEGVGPRRDEAELEGDDLLLETWVVVCPFVRSYVFRCLVVHPSIDFWLDFVVGFWFVVFARCK